ncbi:MULTISPECIES: hypothetical protein [unclassified Microbacterium]|uniref:hypothetical protein n=1 Tax=unclassified Microbacterium TaxID=2609290 RepID=UPI000EAA4665|nr:MULTISPECIES: hypothetical protein [unclassified Microbacterium]MBT2484893.1 hypothetical protein [Microbacterium sp. ISL-108]RKN67759.1 hypothetical protein D7252_09255 [Microbacterium sp. CGR2]
MDVGTFYALFSTTCFTLTGLWWNVVRARRDWSADPAMRRTIGGIYLSFLLPALMGLFAQVGGTDNPILWRLSFVVIALVGGVSMLRLVVQARGDGTPGSVRWAQAGTVVIYAAIAVMGVAPQLAAPLGLTGIQVEALLLIALVALGHALVWRFLVTENVPE